MCFQLLKPVLASPCQRPIGETSNLQERMPDGTEEGTPLLGPSRSESPVRPRRLFEERRGCCSSPLIICVGLSLGVWLSVRAQAQVPPVAGTNRTSAATPPSSAEQPPQYDEVPVPRAAPLRLDGTLEAALRAAVPAGRPRFLLLTFGNAAIGPLLRNFALHCRRAGIPHVVGAVDVEAFELLAEGEGSRELILARTRTRTRTLTGPNPDPKPSSCSRRRTSQIAISRQVAKARSKGRSRSGTRRPCTRRPSRCALRTRWTAATRTRLPRGSRRAPSPATLHLH